MKIIKACKKASFIYPRCMYCSIKRTVRINDGDDFEKMGLGGGGDIGLASVQINVT